MKKRSFNTQILIAMLLSFALMFVLNLAAYAAEDGDMTGGTATVKGDSVNVRKEAGKTDGDPVAKIKKGETYTIIGSSKDGDGKVWYEIKGDNFTGYVRYDLVDVKAPEPEEPEATTEEPETTTEEPADDGGDSDPGTAVNTPTAATMNLTPMQTDAQPQRIPEGFREVTVSIGGELEVPSWTNDTFYIFYATSPSGNEGWYLYDSVESKYVRYADFLLEQPAEAAATGGSNKGLVIVLIVIILVLAAVAAFLAFKAFGSRDYDDDDDDDDDEDDFRSRRAASVRSNAAPVRTAQPNRPAPQGRPAQGAARPQAGDRPAPQRREGGARPAGQGAPARNGQGARPAGVRPAGSGQPTRRQQGQPAGRRTTQGGQSQMRQSRPVVDEDDE